MTASGKIDVHHHVYPPVYTEALHRNGGDPSGWYIPPWTTSLDDEAEVPTNKSSNSEPIELFVCEVRAY